MKAEGRTQKSEVNVPRPWERERVARQRRVRVVGWMLAVCALAALAGCDTLDKAYEKQVTWTNAPVVEVVTNEVVSTNTAAEVVYRYRIVPVTNEVTGAVSSYETRDPVATNFVTVRVTNEVPVFRTNLVPVVVTNTAVAGPAAWTIDLPGPLSCNS